jgi:hypothetical protein
VPRGFRQPFELLLEAQQWALGDVAHGPFAQSRCIRCQGIGSAGNRTGTRSHDKVRAETTFLKGSDGPDVRESTGSAAAKDKGRPERAGTEDHSSSSSMS